MERDRRVAVVIESSNAYGRGLLEGIRQHVLGHEYWTIFLPEHGRGTPPLEQLTRWRGDGVIARIETAAIAGVIRGLTRRHGTPVVDVSAARLVADVPYVETDDAAIAAAAAAHLLERDFRQLAFLGAPEFRWSGNRQEAFVAVMRARGLEPHVYRPPAGRRGRPRGPAADQADGTSGETDEAAVERWLVGLPKPVGVFACYDIRGRQAVEACHRAGLAIPDAVAVIGVDDDPLICGLASPALSSVIPDAVGAGRLAADLLERLMAGLPLDRAEWLLPPLGVATRRSTDTLVVDDPLVLAALREIRDHACDGLRVNDVAAKLGTSRRVLETRFARLVGHTPHEEIAAAVFRRVEQLLAETDLPLAAIAERCGFRHAEYMTVAFARRHGMPPSRWRKARRG
jgi:LacI family transcriptional regulator